jgi:hypothetical protein
VSLPIGLKRPHHSHAMKRAGPVRSCDSGNDPSAEGALIIERPIYIEDNRLNPIKNFWPDRLGPRAIVNFQPFIASLARGRFQSEWPAIRIRAQTAIRHPMERNLTLSPVAELCPHVTRCVFQPCKWTIRTR